MNNDKLIQRKGIVLCLSGPSGVGKGTVIHALCELYEDLTVSVSVTTRTPRPGEREGIEYYFVDKPKFQEMLANNEILEHDRYVDNDYGTPRGPIEKMWQNGEDVVLDITVAGSLAVKENFPDAVTIFLLPPSVDELELRLTSRGTEEQNAVEKRLDFAKKEMQQVGKFQYVLVNNQVRDTAEQLWHILEAERHKVQNTLGIEEVIKNL